MKLLLLNALKGMRKKKVQMLAIIAIITLSSTIYIATNTAINRVENGYYNYLEKENVEHFSFTPKVDFKTMTADDIKLLDNVNLNESEKQIFEIFKTCYTTTCNEEVYKYVDFIYKKYGKNVFLNQKEIEEVAKKHGFKYELETSKTFKSENIYIKTVPYVEKTINKFYLVEGTFPKEKNEVTILPGFAKANEIKIGDQITVDETSYKVSGFAYLSDHIYPLISLNVPIFSEKTNNIMIMNNDAYKELNYNEELIYAARFDEKMSFKGRMQMSFGPSDQDKTSDNSSNPITKVAEEETIEISFLNFARFLRTDTIQGDLEPNRVFTEAFLYLLLGVATFIVVIIVKKRIEDEKQQIGILKSLGYNSVLISASYLVYPIIGVLIGSLIGYGIGILLSNPLSNVYLSFYNLPLEAFKISTSDLTKIVLLPLILLSTISFLTAYLMVKKKPLFLLKEGSNLKVNIFSKIVNKLLSPFSFRIRFKYSLAFRSLGKLFVVSLVSFSSGLLITLVLIGSNLFSNLLDQAFSSMNYDYVVMYTGFMNDEDYESDLIFGMEQKIVKINEKKLEEELDLTLVGIDSELKFLTVIDDKDNNLAQNLHSDYLITIPKRIAEVNKIKVDDTVTFSINNEEISFKVSGISEDYFSSNAFVDRELLSEIFNFEKPVYNQKFTNKDYSNLKKINADEALTIANVFSVSDLKENIEGQVETFNSVIYFVIFFASFMALIIVLVIANIVVEENKKNISLMKVLGYKNKDISNIVLRIYTPFIIVAYLISVPVMVNILKAIVETITKDINLFIPIEASMLHVTIGLIGLLIAYTIGVNVSRRVLNKIPLAIALKRE